MEVHTMEQYINTHPYHTIAIILGSLAILGLVVEGAVRLYLRVVQYYTATTYKVEVQQYPLPTVFTLRKGNVLVVSKAISDEVDDLPLWSTPIKPEVDSWGQQVVRPSVELFRSQAPVSKAGHYIDCPSLLWGAPCICARFDM